MGICTYVHMYVYKYVYIYIYIHMYIYTYIYICMFPFWAWIGHRQVSPESAGRFRSGAEYGEGVDVLALPQELKS